MMLWKRIKFASFIPVEACLVGMSSSGGGSPVKRHLVQLGLSLQITFPQKKASLRQRSSRASKHISGIMKFLVFGGGGKVARHFARLAIAEGHEVIPVVRDESQ